VTLEPTIEPDQGRPSKPAKPRAREITVQQFLSLYKSVGAQLGELAKLDAAAASALSGRYKTISPQSAIRSPQVRQQAYRELGTLRRQVRRAIRQAR
jgi:hypothetical protein